MKAKKDVKAGRISIKAAVNLSSIRQYGFANYAEVYQVAVVA
jgi:hypothetical protein